MAVLTAMKIIVKTDTAALVADSCLIGDAL
jgi:hypothetical protein